MNDKTVGKSALDGFREADVKPGDDERPTPPGDDNPNAVDARGAADSDPPAADAKPPQDDDTNKSEPKGPPADDVRSKIFSRFDQRREAQAKGETVPLDGEPTPPPEGDGKIDETTPKAPAKPGPSDSGDTGDKPQTLTLKVNGKEITKSIQEIAVLSDLTPEEVLEKPERAIRYAQIEVAKTQNLDEARRIRRETPSRQIDDAARPARPDPNQDRKPPGTEDASDQLDPDRKTTGDVDFTKLVEDIQIADPKEAGQKLKDAFETIAKTQANKAVVDTEASRIARDHSNGIVKSMNEFIDAHPDIKESQERIDAVTSAMTPALYVEYREDLIGALQAEDGISRDEAAALVASVGRDDIAKAHKARRMRGDPNVRQIDKAFFETAYERMTKNLGIKADPTKQQTPQQDITQTRDARKRALPHQPQRASQPPATPPAPAKPITRSSVVQDMRRGRGQKPHHAR